MAVRKMLFGVLAFICVVGLLIGVSQWRGFIPSSGRTLGGSRDIKLGCPLPEVPDKVPRLKVIYRDVTTDEIKGIAEGVFNLSGDVKEIPHDKYFENGGVSGLYLENSGVELWLFRSGAVAYSAGKGGRRYVPKNLPSYERAKEIAENFVQMVKAHGLMPENFDMRFANVGPAEITVEITVIGENYIFSGEKEIVHSLCVDFGLYYKDFRISGRGVHVTLGENGEILSFGGLWRRVEEAGHTAITVSPEKAVEMLKARGFSLAGPLPQKAVIEKMELVYWIKADVNEPQDYLQPVYLFRMVGEKDMWHEIVPATDEPFNF